MKEGGDFTSMDSSMFLGHRYDPNTRVLTLKFKNGAVYQHEDVSAEKFETFTGSESPGRYYNEHIKSNHPGKKL